jgi:FPC/CPF motif-containing protein YcgG
MIMLNLSLKWRFDNKGIGSDQNLLKRKIKEALKSTEGRTIIENLTSSGTADANRVKAYFYRNNDDGILVLSNKAIEDFIDGQFNNIFKF